jgi:uncharacterized Zn finger protein (UPF0148 family)
MKEIGMFCPQCGTEMRAGDSRLLIMTNPPQREVYCPQCGYTASVLAEEARRLLPEPPQKLNGGDKSP